MTRDQLLESLAVERYTNPWWTTTPPTQMVAEIDPVDQLAGRRRLAEAVAEADAHEDHDHAWRTA